MVAARQNIGLVVRWARELRASRQLLAFFVIGLILLGELAMAAESRVALVIGNRDYRTGSLANAINDSRAMRELLIRHGFQVVYRENLKTNEIGSTLLEFKNKLGQGAVALFYYSGHGSQFRGVNYLHSVNDESTNEFDLPQQNLTANQVLNVMVEARTRVNLVMLDACRDNPFKVFGRSLEGGLARMAGPAGTLISFATHPGAIAKDDGPDGHGLYTGFLLKLLSGSPDVEIERIFKLVSNEVYRYSKGSQIPWIEGVMLGDDFCFGACRSSVSAPPSPSQISSAALLDQNVPQPKPAASAAAAPSASASAKPAPATASTKPISLVPEQKERREKREPRDPAKILAEGPRPQVPASAPSPDEDLEGCKKSIFEACERAARAGNPFAQATLGWMYTSGEGVTKNLEVAAYWYRVAADLGEVGSQKTMAQFYYYGFGVKPDNTLSFYWWKKAAEQGDLTAQKMTAEYYADGRGVSTDRRQAVYWYQKAIEQGDISGMYEVARLYERGLDGLDPEQAQLWYRRCAELEVPVCQKRQLRQAWQIIDEAWWNKDKKSGIEMIQQLAQRGYAPALLDLGRLYAAGKHLDKDLVKAAYWLRKALEKGESSAQAELNNIGY